MELKFQNRVIFGKRVNGLRKEGLIPAEIYGHGIKNEHVSVSAKEFKKVFKEAGETTIVNLVGEKGEKFPVIISDISMNHLTDEVLAVDFHHVNLNEKLEAKVPVVFTGTAPAEKKGLVLVHVTSEIDVEALPQDIPHEFPVDLSSLEEAGQGIYVKDLKVAAKVKVKTPADMAIVTVTEQKKEETVPPPAPAAEAAAPAQSTEAATPEEKK